MHPPFFVVDHKVGPHKPVPFAPRPHVRRTTPEVLRFHPVIPGQDLARFAPVPFVATPAPNSAVPSAPQSQSGPGGWLARLWRGPQRSYA